MYCSPCPQVTQPGAGVVLALAGPESGELVAEELEMQLRSLTGMMSRLARERDLGAQVGDSQGRWGCHNPEQFCWDRRPDVQRFWKMLF